MWPRVNLNSFKSYLGKNVCYNPYLWMHLLSSFFHHFAHVSESSFLNSEFPIHMSLCKIPICPIVPIDSPLKEENIILDAVLIGRPRVCTLPPPWKIWYVNCHGIGLFGRWWSSFFHLSSLVTANVVCRVVVMVMDLGWVDLKLGLHSRAVGYHSNGPPSRGNTHM